MKTQFEVLRIVRNIILKELEGLALDQIYDIPKGLKNNIFWNMAHLVVTQQLLHYKATGLDCLCLDELIEEYRKGTVPEKTFTSEEFEEVKDLFRGSLDTLEEDFEVGIFQNYTTYQTSTGLVLDSTETAIVFNNLHEGMHCGIIRSMKKFL
jgi:hypothetical protein